jgi:hypothetical protein
MPTPTFTTPPTAPARTQGRTVFNANMAAFLAWLVTWAGEAATAVTWMAEQVGLALGYKNAASASEVVATAAKDAAIAATNYVRESSASLAIGTGAKSVTGMAAGAAFANGDIVSLVSRSNLGNRMKGAVSSMNAGAGTMTVTVASADDTLGSGTHADWFVVLSSLEALPAATAAQVAAATSTYVAATPGALKAAAAFQVLTDGANIAWNMALGLNGRVTLGGNRNVSAPTNGWDAAPIMFHIGQDATGGRMLTWDAVFDWGAVGAPTLSTGANKVDFAFGFYSATTAKWHMTFRKAA